MHGPTRHAAPRGRRPLALVLVAALAACADTLPVAPVAEPDAIPATALQAFDCLATLAGSVSCRAATPSTGPASGMMVGGQGTYLSLSSSNASYDAGTEIFQFDVTVQNLMNEMFGTPDGTMLDPEGIMIFFYQMPTATTGSGEVLVANADGTAFFTGADQPYFAYPVMLSTNEVSPAKTWQFSVPATVESFSFRVYAEADMQYKLVINELLANPGGTITDASGEWFEIYNAGTLPVDLQGLVIADSAASGRRPFHLISSSLVVPAGGYVVLGNSANTTDNGGVPVDYAYGSALAFANSLDALKISRVVGSDTLTLDRVQYSSAAISAQNGISRELTNPALDNANMDGSNWADASVVAVYGPGGRGTPKAQNSTYTP